MAAVYDVESNEHHHRQRLQNCYTSSHSKCRYTHLTEEEIGKLPFDQRVAHAGIRHVFYEETHGPHPFKEHVNIVALARMNLYVLQKDLLEQFGIISQKGPMAMDSEAARNVRRLLHEYCTS